MWEAIAKLWAMLAMAFDTAHEGMGIANDVVHAGRAHSSNFKEDQLHMAAVNRKTRDAQLAAMDSEAPPFAN